MFSYARPLVPVEKRVLPKQRALFHAAARIDGQINKYLLDALKEIKKQIKLEDLAKVVQAADLDDIYRAANAAGIEAATVGLSEELGSGMAAGSALAAKEIGKVVVLDFNRPYVKRWLKDHAAELVVELTNQSKAALKTMVEEGVLKGRHPYRLARDVKETVGLNERLSNAVIRKRAALEKAGVPAVKIELQIERYSDKLLRYRAKMIARTESMAAVNQGRLSLWKQLKDDGAIGPNIEQEFNTSEDGLVCEICGPMDGQRRKIGEPFESPEGNITYAPPQGLHPL